MEFIRDMESKNKQINDLITQIANKTLGITPEQIEKARQMYKDDPRSIEEIKAELLAHSKRITDHTLRQKELESAFKNEKEKEHKAEVAQDDNEGYYKTEYLDLSDLQEYVVQTEEGPTEPVMTSVADEPTKDSSNELDSMFQQPTPEQAQPQSAKQATEEKGKSLVKTTQPNNIGNQGGFSSALNLSFMLSTVSILGLFIASMVVLISRLFA